MDYKTKIHSLISKIDPTLVDFETERKKGRKPTSASSEFLTNRSQGDWAEKIFFKSANKQLTDFVFVKYGVSDNIVVGEDGFDEFYEKYQQELDQIGKRPDLLVFHKKHYQLSWGKDISNLSLDELADIVPLAIAGLEIRSSSFVENKYEKEINKKVKMAKERAFAIREQLLTYEGAMSDMLIQSLREMDEENIAVQEFRIQVNATCEQKEEIKVLLRQLKDEIKLIQKRDFLSFTPKLEDLSLVNKWIQTYGVPHFYIQVFYDRVYGISFEEILTKLTYEDGKNKHYFIERDVKNQMKSTIKINVNDGVKLGENKKLPKHESAQKVFKRGRVVHYVKLRGGSLQLNLKKCKKLWT